MVVNGADADNHEIYAYGAECVLSEIIANITVFSISFLFGFPLEMLIWQLFWLPLRLYIGGFHSKVNHIICTIISTAIAVGSILVIPYVSTIGWIIWIEVGTSILITFSIAPIIHPNHPMSEKRVRKAKRYGRIICIIEVAAITLAYFLLPGWVSQAAALGMFMACVMCIIGKFTMSTAI